MQKQIINFSGLQFQSSLGVAQITDSDNSKPPYSFDLEINNEHLGQLIYFCQYPLTGNIEQKFNWLTQRIGLSVTQCVNV